MSLLHLPSIGMTWVGLDMGTSTTGGYRNVTAGSHIVWIESGLQGYRGSGLQGINDSPTPCGIYPPCVKAGPAMPSDKFGQSNCVILREAHIGTRHGLNSMGILTVEAVPGLNCHFRNVMRAALSSWGFPVLCAIEASITLPLPGSTDTTQTPLPVMPSKRALGGYGGAGA